MAKKYSSVLGVDVGSATIKVAEIKLQGRKPVITAYGMVQTPEGAVDHVGLHDGEAVGAVLKDLAASIGATVGDVVVTMAGQGSVLVRTLEVPTMSDSELKQHMEWEITRNIPFAESTVQSDFQAFPPSSSDAQNMDVVMAIATQSSVDTALSMIKRAGKKPAALDVEPLALARSVSLSYDQNLRGRTVCMVEIGHKTTAINMYRDGQLLMPRQVPVGGEMVTRAIADNLNMSFAEAEALKHRSAELPESAVAQSFNPFDAGAQSTVQTYNPFATDSEVSTESVAPVAPEPAGNGLGDESNRIYNAIANAMDEFVSEVRRSIDYFRSKGGEVDMVLLCGGGSKIKGMSRFMTSALGVNSDLYDPTREILVDAKKGDAELLQESKQDFAVAIGNGLHICF